MNWGRVKHGSKWTLWCYLCEWCIMGVSWNYGRRKLNGHFRVDHPSEPLPQTVEERVTDAPAATKNE